MAKVRFDQETRDNKILRDKLGLYLRLEFALQGLGEKALTVEHLAAFNAFKQKEDVVFAYELQIEEPPEIAEAWRHLDALPNAIVQELRTIRQALHKWTTALKGHANNAKFTPSHVTRPDNPTWDVAKQAQASQKACGKAIDQLSAAIKKITEQS